MGDEGGRSAGPEVFIQKQKEALAKAKSLVHRPIDQKSVHGQNVQDTNSNPFITYPEFAPSSQQSASSMISFRRLFLAFYLTAGASATIYIASKVFTIFLLH